MNPALQFPDWMTKGMPQGVPQQPTGARPLSNTARLINRPVVNGIGRTFLQAGRSSVPALSEMAWNSLATSPATTALVPAAFAGGVGVLSRGVGNAVQRKQLSDRGEVGSASREMMAKRNDVMGISKSASDAWRGNRLPSHWNDNSNAFPALPKAPDEPTPDAEQMGPPNLGAGEQPPPSALPFNDSYIKAARSDYDVRSKSINDILNPIQRDREEQLYNLRNGVGRDDSGLGEAGRAMKSALTLNMIQGYEGDQADMAKSRASGIGALNPDSLTGTKYGMHNKEASEQALFKESLPSSQSAIELQKAQAAVAKHAALPENLTSKAESQREKIEAHARELGSKAYLEAIKTKTDEEARDIANIVMWQAQGKDYTAGTPRVDEVKSWRGDKPAIPAIPARLKQSITFEQFAPEFKKANPHATPQDVESYYRSKYGR